MAYDLVSEDGLARSNDPNFIGIWNRIAKQQVSERRVWLAEMLALGAKAAAPDDGWVDRQRSTFSISGYADLRATLETGDLMALGGPESWRLVRVTGYRRNPFILGAEGRIYSFEASHA